MGGEDKAREMMRTNGGAFSPHQIEALEKAIDKSQYPDVLFMHQDAHGNRRQVLWTFFTGRLKTPSMFLPTIIVAVSLWFCMHVKNANLNENSRFFFKDSLFLNRFRLTNLRIMKSTIILNVDVSTEKKVAARRQGTCLNVHVRACWKGAAAYVCAGFLNRLISKNVSD